MVVVSREAMSTDCLALVGAGPLPDLLLQRFSRDVADRNRSSLHTTSIQDDPDAVLSDCSSNPCLLSVSGDGARLLPRGSSWLEALADWRMPTLLLTQGDSEGTIPGSAAAHVALCRQLGVPLIGLVQLQGAWDRASRRRDALPWCGWVPDVTHPQHDDGLNALIDLIRSSRLKGQAARAAV